MPFSHHSHSGQFCKHASGTLEEVVQEAILQGFRVYGLTEHCPRYRVQDLYPEEAHLSLDDLQVQFSTFLDEAHRLKRLHADKITLLVGVETEYISSLDLDALFTLLKTHGERIEYLVGSVHHVNEIPIDFDRPTFDKCLASFSHNPQESTNPSSRDPEAMERLLSAYFDAQHTLITQFKPSVVGHIDLCRLYHPNLRLPSYPKVWEKVKRNVLVAIEYGALFEVNAAAFRKGWGEAYPGSDVLEFILSNGGRLTLSDDSHGPHAVGLIYARLHDYLRSQNVQELWYLAPKPPSRDSASQDAAAASEEREWSVGVVAQRVEGRWWEDSFWSRVCGSEP